MKILKSIWAGLEYLGRARNASILARQGNSEEAIKLMNKKFI